MKIAIISALLLLVGCGDMPRHSTADEIVAKGVFQALMGDEIPRLNSCRAAQWPDTPECEHIAFAMVTTMEYDNNHKAIKAWANEELR